MAPLIMFLLLVGQPRSSPKEEGQPLIQRVLKELPAAHREIEREIDEGVVGAVHIATWVRPFTQDAKTKKTVYQADAPLFKWLTSDFRFWHYAASSKDVQLIFSRGRNLQIEEVRCHRDRTRFSLRKAAGDRDYSISFYDDRFESKDGYWLPFKFWHLVTASFALKGLRFQSLMEDPSFAIREVAPVERNGKSCLRVVFDLEIKKPSPPHPRYRSGWIVVFPEDHWAIQEARLGAVGEPDGYFTMTVDYSGERPARAPMPSRVSFQYEPSDTARKSMEVYEARGVQLARPSRDEFTLSYYGVPDVGKPAQRRSRYSTPLIFIGLALLALVLSVVLKRAASRREPSTSV